LNRHHTDHFLLLAKKGIETVRAGDDDVPMSQEIAGQLNSAERRLLVEAVSGGAGKPKVVLEVGTWLGGGSTIHLLKALQSNGDGHLWGIEADRGIYEQMMANLRQAAPEGLHRFTPVFGFSQKVIPGWLAEQKPGFQIDVAFLDGGNRPSEQITEFNLIDPFMPVGARLLSHDGKLRKGKWLVPFVSLLDNWESKLHDISQEGLFQAKKVAAHPSPASARAARRKLLRLRLSPPEVAAALLPSGVCGMVLRVLPSSISRRLSEGRAQA
jgi:hypothetical protein